MGPNQVEELKEVSKKIFVLCSPWPAWIVSGSFITEFDPEAGSDQPTPRSITESDIAGDRILSFIPVQLHGLFLSSDGQKLVSHFQLHYP